MSDITTPAIFREEECFNVFWKIKNFSFCCKSIKSPIFKFCGHEHYIQLNAKNFDVDCSLVRNHYSNFTHEISFLTYDGSPEESISGTEDVSLQVPGIVLVRDKQNAFLLEDTLTIRIRCLTQSERGKLLMCSHIDVKFKHFLWIIDNFSKGLEYKMKFIEKDKNHGDIKLHAVSLVAYNSPSNFSVEISREGGGNVYCVLKVSVLDVNGEELNEISDDFNLCSNVGKCQTRPFPPIIQTRKLLSYKNLLLPEDTLTLKCFFAVSSRTTDAEIAVISFCQYSPPLLKEYKELSDVIERKNYAGRLTELQTDLKSILDNGAFSDVSLTVGTDIIRVHKNILSARSPVFKSMFATDMKESVNNTVVIEDLDVDTVRRLLIYMYTDSLAENQWENIKHLYNAADKYGILSLKNKCVSYLKTILSISNVIEALVFADQYQDRELKMAALSFISKHVAAVICSDPWEKLKNSNASLALQIMNEI